MSRLVGANFNTLGSWGSSTCPDCWQTDGAAQAAAIRHGMYYTAIILFATLFNREHNTSGFPDVFDPAFATSADASARLACAPRVNDSMVLGYFLDNENSCPPVSDAKGNSVLDQYLGLAPGAPGHVAAKEFIATHAGVDIGRMNERLWSAMRAMFSVAVAKQYFEVTSAAVRRYDPTHLVLGCKFMAVDGLAPILAVASPYVDAHALDVYAFTPGIHYLSELYAAAGSNKPFIIAEFGFQARENMGNGTAAMGGAGPVLNTQIERAAAWQDFVGKAISLPFVVGTLSALIAPSTISQACLDQPENISYASLASGIRL